MLPGSFSAAGAGKADCARPSAAPAPSKTICAAGIRVSEVRYLTVEAAERSGLRLAGAEDVGGDDLDKLRGGRGAGQGIPGHLAKQRAVDLPGS